MKIADINNKVNEKNLPTAKINFIEKVNFENLVVKNFNLSKYETIHQMMKPFTINRTKDTIDEIWLLEHHPVFTLGLAGKKEHILQKSEIPIVQTDRGGQVTYHGPGQLICYFLIDLKRKDFKIKQFVYKIEQAVIDFLQSFDINAHRIDNAPGIYVDQAKICSMGLKIKKGCSYHQTKDLFCYRSN